MKIQFERSKLLKAKGQISLPPIPLTELSPDASDIMNAILADILNHQFNRKDTDENTET